MFESLLHDAPVSGVYRPTRLPGVQIPEIQLPQIRTQSVSMAEQIRNRHLASLDRPSAQAVSRVACQANTIWELSQVDTLDEAISQAVREYGGDAMLRERIRALTQELASPKSKTSGQGGGTPPFDIAESTRKITTFVFCEGVSREYGG